MLRSLMPTPALPESFLFGVATADHQCESYDQKCEDIRDVWERRRTLTPRGWATDFWNRYREDIGLAQALGCRAFRFSIAWSRVEPTAGVFDEQAFAHYQSLIEAIRAAGMEPILTLHHFTWPIHIEERGGMVADNFPALFARYVAEVVNRFGKLVRYWITFNEPTQLVYGYIKPWWERDYFVPPGLPEGATIDQQTAAVGRLIRNLFVAHTAARTVIKRGNPDALVGTNPLLLGLPVWLQRLVDLNVTRMRGVDDWMRQGRRFVERALLEHGDVDVIVATLTMTPERASQVDFSEVYAIAGQTLLVAAGSPIGGPRDLVGKTVAVVKSSTAEAAISRLIPEANVQVVGDYAAALAALDAGQVAAILADDTILVGLLITHQGRYQLAGDLLTDEPYAAAVARGNPQLLDAVDAAVRQFKESGAWATSYAQHFPGRPVAQPPNMASRLTLANVSGKEPPPGTPMPTSAAVGPLPLAPKRTLLRRIQDRGYIVIGVKEDVPGFGYHDPQTGTWSGLEIDLARAIALFIFGDSASVRFRPATTQERIPLLRSIVRVFDPLLKQIGILSTALTSNWWHLGMAGKLPEFLCPPECVGQQDFVGFDYYWGISTLQLNRIQRLMDAAMGRFDRAPVWPAALHGMLKYHAALFPDKPILIIENGSVELADGVDRATYIRQHIRQIQRACNNGIPVAAYICWSITSNREWGLAFDKSSDFGLYHIDLDTDPQLKRTPTSSIDVYRDIIKQRGA
jgi:beta-glucosidase/6-phospho-beta-glucosidase/beta-galactosidase/ABC-type amino acid transport substrate-binding protein